MSDPSSPTTPATPSLPSTPIKYTPTPPITFVIKKWDELTAQEVHDFLRIRVDVFVVEQNAIYSDIDGKDHKAIHVMGYVINPDTQEQEMVAYSRVFAKGQYFDKNACVGRVVVATKWRAYGYGHILLDTALEVLIQNYTMPVTISAQLYLFKFYSSHGFKRVSDIYLEDGIEHVEMLLVEDDLTGTNRQYIGQCKYDEQQ